MASDAEEEIRAAVVDWFHEQLPDARVIHELTCGWARAGCRADLAVAAPDRLYLVEIKSGRDKLDRLKEQRREFERCGHTFIAVLDQKFFTTESWSQTAFRAPKEVRGGHPRPIVWRWPRTDDRSRWTFPWKLRHAWGDAYTNWPGPHPGFMLDLLWKKELLEACSEAGVDHKKRWTRPELIGALARRHGLDEVSRITCAALRRREFKRADPPVL